MSYPILLNIKSAFFNLQCYENVFYKRILLQQVEIKNSILLINDEYVFGDIAEVSDYSNEYKEYTKKVICEVDITDVSKNTAYLKRNDFGKNKTGSLIFLKEDTDDSGAVLREPTLIVQLSLESHYFETIYENLKLKNKISSMKIEVEDIGLAKNYTFLKWTPSEPVDSHSYYNTNILSAAVIFEIF